MKITYHPATNSYDIDETDSPYRKVNYIDARRWLRGDGYTPYQVRHILMLAFVHGCLGQSFTINK